jgi:hypothetical protein
MVIGSHAQQVSMTRICGPAAHGKQPALYHVWMVMTNLSMSVTALIRDQ